MNERNENVLSAEKEETVLCYLNPHVKTVHDEEKIILFLSYFCESKITKYEWKKCKPMLRYFISRKSNVKKKRHLCCLWKKLFESQTKFNLSSILLSRPFMRRKKDMSFSPKNYLNQNSNWISIFEQTKKEIKLL